MKTELIAQIRNALEAAMPGEWDLHANAGYCGIMRGGKPLFSAYGAIVADGRLACLLRNHAAEMLDEIERLRAELMNATDANKRLRRERDRIQRSPHWKLIPEPPQEDTE